jgi:hypothetical protein
MKMHVILRLLIFLKMVLIFIIHALAIQKKVIRKFVIVKNETIMTVSNKNELYTYIDSIIKNKCYIKKLLYKIMYGISRDFYDKFKFFDIYHVYEVSNNNFLVI